jgi:hypothetical protein
MIQKAHLGFGHGEYKNYRVRTTVKPVLRGHDLIV